MKKVLAVILIVICLSSFVWANEKKDEPKFAFIFTITYKALTIKEAAEKEAKIRNYFDDGCVIQYRKP